MSGYPVIYWVVVAIFASAVSAVLIGWGYLMGLKVANRRAAGLVATVRDELARNRETRTMPSPEWLP